MVASCKLIPWNCLPQSVFLAPRWLALFMPVRLAVGFRLNSFAHSPFRLAWTRTYDAWCLFCTRVNANQPIIGQALELQVLTGWATLWKVDNLHGSSLLRDHGTRRKGLNPRYFLHLNNLTIWIPRVDVSGVLQRLVRRGRRRWDMHLLDTSFLSRSMTFWWRRVWIWVENFRNFSNSQLPVPNCPWFRVDDIQCDLRPEHGILWWGYIYWWSAARWPCRHSGGYFQAKDGSKAADWELPVRIGKTDSALTAEKSVKFA